MRAVHAKRYRAFVGLLREAREEAGLTQAAVAKALGRPQSYLSKCERAERRVDVIELAELARLYGKPLSYFVPDSSDTKRRR